MTLAGNEVIRQPADGHAIYVHRFRESDLFQHLLALTREKGWEVVADEPKDGRIEAVDRSLLYGFPDEITIRIVASNGDARVDLRSRSRIGRIDRGVSTKRIRVFLAALKENAGKVK